MKKQTNIRNRGLWKWGYIENYGKQVKLWCMFSTLIFLWGQLNHLFGHCQTERCFHKDISYRMSCGLTCPQVSGLILISMVTWSPPIICCNHHIRVGTLKVKRFEHFELSSKIFRETLQCVMCHSYTTLDTLLCEPLNKHSAITFAKIILLRRFIEVWVMECWREWRKRNIYCVLVFTGK